MPLLTATIKKSKKVSLRVWMDKNLLEEVNAYCNWAGIHPPSEFAAQAMQYVLKNDKDWRKVYVHPNIQQDAMLPTEEGLHSRGQGAA